MYSHDIVAVVVAVYSLPSLYEMWFLALSEDNIMCMQVDSCLLVASNVICQWKSLAIEEDSKRGKTSEVREVVVYKDYKLCLLKRKLILLKKGFRVNLIGNKIEE